MNDQLYGLARNWISIANGNTPSLVDYYCQTQDVFQARLQHFQVELSQKSNLSDDAIYLIVAIVGEIGNNSFDHNIGHWPDIPGIFFAYDFAQNASMIILADRGQGVLATLKQVKPQLRNDMQALETAFKEKISGRAPENRGNGLKFVRESIQQQHLHLTFFSGQAQAELNQQMAIKATEGGVNGCLAVLTF